MDDLTAASPQDKDDSIAVTKGDYLNIRETAPTLQEITLGVGWDQKMFEENPLDVDFSCFLLNKADQTREDEDFLFYNNETTCAGAVRHTGDSRNGAGDGDDEQIIIDLNGVPFDVLKIAMAVTIYNGAEREQHFGSARNLYIRLADARSGQEILRYRLNEEEFKGEIGIKLGELVREGPAWFFNAQGEPIPGGLATIAKTYGINVML